MSRAQVKQLRRVQLIEATIGAIARHGFAETTLAQVARHAKLSQGIVNFYFRSKEELFAATLRHMVEEYDAHWRAVAARAGPSPAAQLLAMVEADFDPATASRKKVTVWYAFWGEARWRPEYLRLCARASDDFLQQTRTLCQRLIEEGGYPEVDADLAARGLNAMIDGLWLDILVNPQGVDRRTAKRTSLAFLAALFPGHFSAGAGAAPEDRRRVAS